MPDTGPFRARTLCGIGYLSVTGRGQWVLAALLGAMLVSCGAASTDRPVAAGQAASTSTSVLAPPGRSTTGQLTTTDGNQYTLGLVVGVRSATGSPDCPATATPGRAFLPVTLTVTNAAADRAVPMPPVRVELTAGAGTKPLPVLLRDGSGSCTFAPRTAQIDPGATLTFVGTSPAIDAAAAAGAAGLVTVSISENRFTLTTPVP